MQEFQAADYGECNAQLLVAIQTRLASAALSQSWRHQLHNQTGARQFGRGRDQAEYLYNARVWAGAQVRVLH